MSITVLLGGALASVLVIFAVYISRITRYRRAQKRAGQAIRQKAKQGQEEVATRVHKSSPFHY